MTKLWQLKELSTGKNLSEPQVLPENWGPIFGLQGVLDKIGNLSWLGEHYNNMGWIEVGDAPVETKENLSDTVWNDAKKMLIESDWTMLPDVPMTSEQKVQWIEYRKKLREIRLQPGFPNDVKWPKVPD